MEYRGTAGNDIIGQATLNIPDWSVIYGGAGDDLMTIGSAHALGEAGNDTITGTSGATSVVYWTSPKGIVVNLTTGRAEDGFGTIDTLINIRTVHGTGYNDVFTGSAGNDYFHGGGGNDSFMGAGGEDQVNYYFVKSTDAVVTYDAAADTFTVRKNFANDHGTDILAGIAQISFGGDGSDHVTLGRNNFVALGGFLRTVQTVPTVLPANAYGAAIKAGDFNGDGHADFAISTAFGTGTGSSASLFYAGDGNGGFSDQTASIAQNGALAVEGGGRTLAADFNKDGVSDLITFNQGDDAPPFAGGLNGLYLSSPSTGRLEDASATLPRKLDFNHAGSIGDVNGDAYLDVLVNTLSSGNVLYVNDGSGHFVVRPDLLPHPMAGSTAQSNTQSGMVDVNADGHLDLILGRWDGDSSAPTSQVLLNDGTGNFTKIAGIDLPASPIAREIVLDVKAIDLNGDALPDLMLSITNGGEREVFYQTAYIQLLVNQGNGKFVDETAARLPATIQDGFGKGGWIIGLTSADFNHDGSADILATSAGGTLSSRTLMNRGDGTFYQGWVSAPGQKSVALDANGDGMADLLTYHPDTRAYVEINTQANGHVYKADIEGQAFSGSSGHDTLIGNAGANSIAGAGGLDTVHYGAARANYELSRTATGFLVRDKVGRDGSDQLSEVERIHFSDISVALDIGGTGGQAYRIYQAAFDRAPDAGGLGFWIGAMDRGASLNAVAAGFVDSAEFKTAYGAAPSHADIIGKFYGNVLHRSADPAGFNYWVAVLDGGAGSPAEVLAAFSESPENQAALAAVIGNGIAYTPF